MTRDQFGAWVLIAIALAAPTALIIHAALRDVFANAQGVIDDAPYVITNPQQYAASKNRHPSQVRTYWACCGHEECTCGTGLGDQAEAWLRARGEQVYDWAEDEGSGLA